MADHVCPPWLGYVLLNPLRRFIEDPGKMLGPLIREGDTVLEPGCGMGYFTLPMARMVGAKGRIIALDIQVKMLEALEKRANRAGLGDRIILHQAEPGKMSLESFAGKIDLAVAIHMVHELQEPETLFSEILCALKPHGKILIVEPKGHVSSENFDRTRALASGKGFMEQPVPRHIRGRIALFSRR